MPPIARLVLVAFRARRLPCSKVRARARLERSTRSSYVRPVRPNSLASYMLPTLRPELVRFDGSGRFFISRDEAWYHLWK